MEQAAANSTSSSSGSVQTSSNQMTMASAFGHTEYSQCRGHWKYGVTWCWDGYDSGQIKRTVKAHDTNGNGDETGG